MTEKRSIILGGGCFWCIEAIYKDLKGVIAVKSGYAGGDVPNPTYEQVCTGATGHAEVVKVTYLSEEIPLEMLLNIFFTVHDPTTLNQQGPDKGTQYRSIVITSNAEETQTVKDVLQQVAQAGLWKNPIVTQIQERKTFYPAEVSHDDYFALNPQSAYCQAVVAPKVYKFRQSYLDLLK
ncbi:peptide-methionine (S)-S-oxide reductase MsrA [Entomobacter blattae]|uniref:Peptide methionine sulfoxide reductase MsrA n=1 Tax=Entomobacter blattae TaxID=2762277 RepID=A0A7H1NT46_9PROT|nr:peptide-methionine (S)-S-oxide reductase MsrA [Entomobacter blattae]QNT78956.1 Peptide methionine sulfoxide reductase MsrA 2 [Entomobacter blattae]